MFEKKSQKQNSRNLSYVNLRSLLTTSAFVVFADVVFALVVAVVVVALSSIDNIVQKSFVERLQ